MKDLTLRFMGREDELAALKNAAEAAMNVTAPAPSFIALTGESGTGKTRLVAEFYRRLIADRGDGYWPADLAGRTVNPDLRLVDTTQRMPFVWLGMKFDGSEKRSSQVSDALSPVRPLLNAHLATGIRDRHNLDTNIDLAGELLTFGISAGASFLGALSGLSLAIEAGELVQAALKKASAASDQANASLGADALENEYEGYVADIIDLLRLTIAEKTGLFGRKTTYRIPLLFVFDDIQFSTNDQLTTLFCKRLMETAKREGWPLIVLMTCWRKEWQRTGADTPPLIDWLRRGPVNDLVTEIALDGDGPAIDFRPAVRDLFPGLTSAQLTRLTAIAGGNARFLTELCAWLRRRPSYFMNDDITGEMKPEKLEQLATSAVPLVELIEDRFHAITDPAIRQALTIGALCGDEFYEPLVLRAAALGKLSVKQQHFDDAARDYAFAARDPHSGLTRFLEPVYQRVICAIAPDILGTDSQIMAQIPRAAIDLLKRKETDSASLPALYSLLRPITTSLKSGEKMDGVDSSVVVSMAAQLATRLLEAQSFNQAGALAEDVLGIVAGSTDLGISSPAVSAAKVMVETERLEALIPLLEVIFDMSATDAEPGVLARLLLVGMRALHAYGDKHEAAISWIETRDEILNYLRELPDAAFGEEADILMEFATDTYLAWDSDIARILLEDIQSLVGERDKLPVSRRIYIQSGNYLMWIEAVLGTRDRQAAILTDLARAVKRWNLAKSNDGEILSVVNSLRRASLRLLAHDRDLFQHASDNDPIAELADLFGVRDEKDQRREAKDIVATAERRFRQVPTLANYIVLGHAHEVHISAGPASPRTEKIAWAKRAAEIFGDIAARFPTQRNMGVWLSALTDQAWATWNDDASNMHEIDLQPLENIYRLYPEREWQPPFILSVVNYLTLKANHAYFSGDEVGCGQIANEAFDTLTRHRFKLGEKISREIYLNLFALLRQGSVLSQDEALQKVQTVLHYYCSIIGTHGSNKSGKLGILASPEGQHFFDYFRKSDAALYSLENARDGIIAALNDNHMGRLLLRNFTTIGGKIRFRMGNNPDCFMTGAKEMTVQIGHTGLCHPLLIAQDIVGKLRYLYSTSFAGFADPNLSEEEYVKHDLALAEDVYVTEVYFAQEAYVNGMPIYRSALLDPASMNYPYLMKYFEYLDEHGLTYADSDTGADPVSPEAIVLLKHKSGISSGWPGASLTPLTERCLPLSIMTYHQ